MGTQKQPGIQELRKRFKRGENISRLLSITTNIPRSEQIEITYELQAGTYIEYALNNWAAFSSYTGEIGKIVGQYVTEEDLVLDCGCGELTSTSAVCRALDITPHIVGLDISLSRLSIGRRYCSRQMPPKIFERLELCSGDIANLPFSDKKIDVLITIHALEPNHGQEATLIREIFRATNRKVLLFEPSWENATDIIRERMNRYGYIRDLPETIKHLGGQLESCHKLTNTLNPLNPTYCYVVTPPQEDKSSSNKLFTCPVTSSPLRKMDGYYWSRIGGYAYPVIDEIPCLRTKNAILKLDGM